MTSRGGEVPDKLIPPKCTWDTLSDELKVAVEIFRLEKCRTQVTLSEIYKSIAVHGIEDKKRVQFAINKLVDLGTVNKEWYEIEDDRWAFKYTISGNSKEFIRKINEELPLSDGYKLVAVKKNYIYMRCPIKSISTIRQFGDKYHTLDVEFYYPDAWHDINDASIVVSDEGGEALLEYSGLFGKHMLDEKTMRVYAEHRLPR